MGVRFSAIARQSAKHEFSFVFVRVAVRIGVLADCGWLALRRAWLRTGW